MESIMNGIELFDTRLENFRESLILGERSSATVSKYMHDVRYFLRFLGDALINKHEVLSYKQHLSERYTVTSANSMIAALNSFLKFVGLPELCTKQFKVQRNAYCEEGKELTREEYLRLVSAARMKKNERLSLVIETICATGIRVSELKFITLEAARKGEAWVNCKGKRRRVFIVRALCKKLIKYSKESGITGGAIFVTKSGAPISRHSVWREMKALCRDAKVTPGKVFPHNLRHLFARTFYGVERDIAKLADILGHASIDTTRIYITTCGSEHRRKLENMRLTT